MDEEYPMATIFPSACKATSKIFSKPLTGTIDRPPLPKVRSRFPFAAAGRVENKVNKLKKNV